MRCSCGYEFESTKVERCPLCGDDRSGDMAGRRLESESEQKISENTMGKGIELNYKLFSPIQIIVATFFGSPFIGSILLAGNFKRLDRAKSVSKALLLGLISTLVIMSLPLIYGVEAYHIYLGHLDNNVYRRIALQYVPLFLIRLAYTGIMGWIVNKVYRADYDRHLLHSGKKESNWYIAVTVLVFFVGIILVTRTVYKYLP